MSVFFLHAARWLLLPLFLWLAVLGVRYGALGAVALAGRCRRLRPWALQCIGARLGSREPRRAWMPSVLEAYLALRHWEHFTPEQRSVLWVDLSWRTTCMPLFPFGIDVQRLSHLVRSSALPPECSDYILACALRDAPDLCARSLIQALLPGSAPILVEYLRQNFMWWQPCTHKYLAALLFQDPQMFWDFVLQGAAQHGDYDQHILDAACTVIRETQPERAKVATDELLVFYCAHQDLRPRSRKLLRQVLLRYEPECGRLLRALGEAGAA